MAAASELVDALRELRLTAGNPPLRDLQDSTGINRTTLSDAFAGKRVPRWVVVERLAVVFNADIHPLRTMWEEAQREIAGRSSASVAAYSTEEDVISCFLSYSREDDDVLKFAAGIKSSLEFYALSSRGRRLQVFLDRDEIEWGDDWQAKVRSGVLGAMVFMPVVTLRYFQRSWCREELLLFHEVAKRADALDLLLPIVIFGHDAISLDSDDPVARIIAERQYVDLQGAVLEGPDSPTWRKALLQLSNDVVAHADAAARHIGEMPPRSHHYSEEVVDDGENDDEVDLVQLSGQAERKAKEIVRLVGLYVEAAEEIEKVVKAFSQKLEQEHRAWGPKEFATLALRLQEPSRRAGDVAAKLESSVVETDGILRQAIRIMRHHGMENEASELVRTTSESLGRADLDEVDRQVELMLDSMRPAEALSISLRKALRPLRSSGKAIGSATRIFRDWGNL